MKSVGISAVGKYLPPKVITNKHFVDLGLDTSEEWIYSRTGIKERRILKGKGLGASDIGANAVKGLLKKKNL